MDHVEGRVDGGWRMEDVVALTRNPLWNKHKLNLL